MENALFFSQFLLGNAFLTRSPAYLAVVTPEYYPHYYPDVSLIRSNNPFEVIKIRLVTVHLPEAYDEMIEVLINKGVYPNRSEAIRVAVRDLLKSELGSLTRQK